MYMYSFASEGITVLMELVWSSLNWVAYYLYAIMAVRFCFHQMEAIRVESRKPYSDTKPYFLLAKAWFVAWGVIGMCLAPHHGALFNATVPLLVVWAIDWPALKIFSYFYAKQHASAENAVVQPAPVHATPTPVSSGELVPAS